MSPDEPEHSGAAGVETSNKPEPHEYLSGSIFTEAICPMNVEDDCRTAILPTWEVQKHRHCMDDDRYSADFPEPWPHLRSLVWHKHRSSARYIDSVLFRTTAPSLTHLCSPSNPNLPSWSWHSTFNNRTPRQVMHRVSRISPAEQSSLCAGPVPVGLFPGSYYDLE